jgi:hypothetical protein
MEKNIEQILSEIKNKLAELEAALEAESAARAAAEAAAAEAEAKAAAERAAAIAADPIDIDIDLSVSEAPDVTTPKSETVAPSFTETRENALSADRPRLQTIDADAARNCSEKLVKIIRNR